jgi:ankyrin repeat domain-containing protein 50
MGRSMQSGLDRIESKVDDLVRGQATLLTDSDSVKFEELKSWLSPIDAERSLQRNLRVYAKSRPSWYLQEDTFRSWRAASASKRTLWWSGTSGAGKTILASFLVAELRQRQPQLDAAGAIFYCSYKAQEGYEQTPTAVMRCLCRQLLEKCSALRFQVEHYKDLMEICESLNTDGEEADEQSLIRDMLHFDQSFIIIDALDECGDRERHELMCQLDAVLKNTPGLRLLVTSRDDQKHLFKDTPHMAITAREEDIENYIRDRMGKLNPLAAIVDVPPHEQAWILKRVVRQSLGIFLQARIHMDALEECEVKDTLRSRTENLSANVEQIYDDAWARILDQTEDRRNIGMSALLWIVRAKRVLKCDELLHAVAASINRGTDDFNDDAIATEKVLVASCGGLISINPDTEFVTIHRSLQEYFQDAKRKTMRFPGAEQEMVKVCLKYLRSQRFAEGHCGSQEELDQRVSRNRFLEYAAQIWGWHVQTIDETSVLEDVLGLLLSNGHLACAAQTLALGPVVTDRVGGRA